MTICIDTNVLIPARALSHPYGVILDACIFGWINWAVSNRIMLEYEEIINRKVGANAWNSLRDVIDLIALSGTLIMVEPHYQFKVVEADMDDNAFTDCAITAHADFIITGDRHFAPLVNAGYKPQPITPEEFISRYQGVYV